MVLHYMSNQTSRKVTSRSESLKRFFFQELKSIRNLCMLHIFFISRRDTIASQHKSSAQPGNRTFFHNTFLCIIYYNFSFQAGLLDKAGCLAALEPLLQLQRCKELPLQARRCAETLDLKNAISIQCRQIRRRSELHFNQTCNTPLGANSSLSRGQNQRKGFNSGCNWHYQWRMLSKAQGRMTCNKATLTC
jgi:hypothetical protein